MRTILVLACALVLAGPVLALPSTAPSPPGGACVSLPTPLGCAEWSRVSQGSNGCGWSGAAVALDEAQWQTAWRRLHGCSWPTPPAPAVDLEERLVAYVGAAHHDCCGHRIQVVEVYFDGNGYEVTYLHYTAQGGFDAYTSPFDAVSIVRQPGVPDVVAFIELATPDVFGVVEDALYGELPSGSMRVA